jgi:16S rRNA (guanine(966)-N(2))-methyltransferase RsmD
LRIISGKYRGKILEAPAFIEVRPTTDFAKTGLFNILEGKIDWEETSALDLFCGIGGITFELLSRGCNKVSSVDRNKACIDFINHWASKMKLNQLSTFCTDVDAFMMHHSGQQYDLIFADPPYGQENAETLIPMILPMLKTDGIFVYEFDGKANLKRIPGLTDIRKYGKVHFAFFKKIHEL